MDTRDVLSHAAAGAAGAAGAAVAYEAWRRTAERTVLDGKPARVTRVDASGLTADADTFQFKSGGDQRGVTDRLKGVTRWNAAAAGKVMVYEYQDGRQVIADGHQRLGLATRLMSEGHAPIKMDAIVLRQADGWSPADVRAYAAIKNMHESSGNALDMARVMRERPDLVTSSLPVSDAKIREARALSHLSEPAFRQVVGGNVKPEVAAAIGEAVKDTSRHADLLTEMQKANVASGQHARLYVSQAMSAPSISETTGSLFGEETQVRSLIRERSQVLDKAITALRSDKRIFGLLEREAANIEGAGNKLAHEANAARAEGAGQTSALIEKLATTRGPVSEMLDRAARAVAEGKTPTQAAREFVKNVGQTLKAGGVKALSGDAAPQRVMAMIPRPPQPKGKATPEANANWGRILDNMDTSPASQKLTAKRMADRLNKQGAQQPKRVMEMAERPQSPPTDRAAYLDDRAYHKTLQEPYLAGDQKIASSRFVPYSGKLPDVGSWRMSSMKGIHGHEIEQLVRVPLKDLVLPELDSAGKLDPIKAGDEVRYAEWLKEGRRAPPIEIVETDKGSLRVMDGHRRALAAKIAGETHIEAWVSSSVDHPAGLKDSQGRPMKTGLTYEIATGQAGGKRIQEMAAPPKGAAQTSFLPEATTSEQIAAKAKGLEAKGRTGDPMTEGLFSSAKDQTDLVEAARAKPARSLDPAVLRNIDRLEMLGYQGFRDAAKALNIDPTGSNPEIRARIEAAAPFDWTDRLPKVVDEFEARARAGIEADMRQFMEKAGVPEGKRAQAVADAMAEYDRSSGNMTKALTKGRPGWSDAARDAALKERKANAKPKAPRKGKPSAALERAVNHAYANGVDVPREVMAKGAKAVREHVKTEKGGSPAAAPAKPRLKEMAAPPAAAPAPAAKPSMLGKVGAALGPVAIVGAAATAFDATRNSAKAAGASEAMATANATAAAAVAGGTVWGIGEVIGKGLSLVSKAAPVVGSVAARAMPWALAAGAGYSAFEGGRKGYEEGGVMGAVKGAAIGAADFATMGAVSHFTAPSAPASSGPVRLSVDQKAQFAQANAAYGEMKKAEQSANGTNGWSDNARIAAYEARMANAGKVAVNAPYGGASRTPAKAEEPKSQPAVSPGRSAAPTKKALAAAR